MIQVPKKFKAFELVDPATYAAFGEQALQFFRPEALQLLDQLSDFFQKPITINNWKTDGQLHWRGLRTIDCKEGAARSAHRLGAGFDFNVSDLKPDLVHAAILANPNAFSRVRRIEDKAMTPGWTHVDVLEHGGTGILVVKP